LRLVDGRLCIVWSISLGLIILLRRRGLVLRRLIVWLSGRGVLRLGIGLRRILRLRILWLGVVGLRVVLLRAGSVLAGVGTRLGVWRLRVLVGLLGAEKGRREGEQEGDHGQDG
jgi:hypothetical protein